MSSYISRYVQEDLLINVDEHSDEAEEERQEINESIHCAKEASQLLLKEKQAIARCEEDLKSEIERGAIALW
ncbi:hypothetical protein M378DRAFT_159991 [Amanita muscaria Koide BX008]|uniref:Uncharacterized protein n=1 Tax=Amanita muscaria (strain Koide BX008) TaxID=946122 RepID=A0A0C2SUH1_AMAMK|nr:hypothetical protein M378DRAFT_159991 [Amanita muscaria Koide BX008]